PWFCGSLGVWCWVRAGNTFQATALTMSLAFFAMGGPWAVTGLCCSLPMASNRGEFEGAYILVAFQTGLTPPAVFTLLPMRSLDELSNLGVKGQVAAFFGSFAPLFFAIAGPMLRAATTQRFAERSVRTDVRRLDDMRAAKTKEVQRSLPVCKTCGILIVF